MVATSARRNADHGEVVELGLKFGRTLPPTAAAAATSSTLVFAPLVADSPMGARVSSARSAAATGAAAASTTTTTPSFGMGTASGSASPEPNEDFRTAEYIVVAKNFPPLRVRPPRASTVAAAAAARGQREDDAVPLASVHTSAAAEAAAAAVPALTLTSENSAAASNAPAAAPGTTTISTVRYVVHTDPADWNSGGFFHHGVHSSTRVGGVDPLQQEQQQQQQQQQRMNPFGAPTAGLFGYGNPFAPATFSFGTPTPGGLFGGGTEASIVSNIFATKASTSAVHKTATIAKKAINHGRDISENAFLRQFAAFREANPAPVGGTTFSSFGGGQRVAPLPEEVD
jgi:hypothetical protein